MIYPTKFEETGPHVSNEISENDIGIGVGREGQSEEATADRPPSFTGMCDPCAALTITMREHEKTFLDRFWTSHRVSNHTTETIQKLSSYWQLFKSGRTVPSTTCPDCRRPIFVFDVMCVERGYDLLLNYAKELLDAKLSAGYRRQRVGVIKQFVDNILKHPYLPASHPPVSVFDLYGPLQQNVDDGVYPPHVRDEVKPGRAFNRRQLRAFYSWLNRLLKQDPTNLILARDLALLIIAAETGLRADELILLNLTGPEVSVFLQDEKLNAEGKGANGSGKRFRLVPLTPLAQKVLAHYIVNVRTQFKNWKTEPALFLTEHGTRVTYACVYNRYQERFKQARKDGVDVPPNAGPHSLRRTKCTNMLTENPRDEEEAQRVLGHAGPGTLASYYCPDNETVTRAIKARVERYRP